MRRKYTDDVVLIMGGLLLAAALIFAWFRSTSLVPTTQPEATEPTVSGGVEEFAWKATGKQTYDKECAMCHGDGQATVRVPPLRGHVARLFETGEGRAYMVCFLLYGRDGSIEVENRSYRPGHPKYEGRLSDVQIAAVLNYVLMSWGNEALLSDEQRLYAQPDVVANRQQPRTPSQVQALRPSLPAQ